VTKANIPLSIIVVNYNTRDATIACLESAYAHSPAGSEVVLVDNGSKDGSVAAIAAAFPAATVVEAGGNVGFARGVNLGVRHARGDYIVLLNPDTIVLDGALSALHAFAVEHPDYGIYGGRTLRPDGTTDPSSCWGAPTLWSLTCFATGLSTAFKRSIVFDPESLGRWERDSVRVVPVITGCLLLTTRANWNDLGGMDETFFLYGEDAEFSVRAGRRGNRPVIVPQAVIVHEVGGSTSSSGAKMSMVMAGKATFLRRSWAPARMEAGVRLLVAGSALRAVLERLAGRRSGTWTHVWRARSRWTPGYPYAEHALFADAAEIAVDR
jgi:N-acetylglucosaminyl-diphospho-decaprenol L-rhamnosyltransferase